MQSSASTALSHQIPAVVGPKVPDSGSIPSPSTLRGAHHASTLGDGGAHIGAGITPAVDDAASPYVGEENERLRALAAYLRKELAAAEERGLLYQYAAADLLETAYGGVLGDKGSGACCDKGDGGALPSRPVDGVGGDAPRLHQATDCFATPEEYLVPSRPPLSRGGPSQPPLRLGPQTSGAPTSLSSKLLPRAQLLQPEQQLHVLEERSLSPHQQSCSSAAVARTFPWQDVANSMLDLPSSESSSPPAEASLSSPSFASVSRLSPPPETQAVQFVLPGSAAGLRVASAPPTRHTLHASPPWTGGFHGDAVLR